MFQNVRPNNQLYILNKVGEVSLSVANVLSVSNPMPRYATNYGTQPFSAEMVVDIVVQMADGSKQELKSLSATQSIADTGSGIVVSDDRQAMMAEIEALMAASKKAIEAVPYHEGVINKCTEILAALNPQLAKDAEADRRMDAMEDRLGKLADSVERLVGILGQPKPRKGTKDDDSSN